MDIQNFNSNFGKLIERIRTDDHVKSSELLPYLSLEHSEERCHANYRLAEAYLEIGNFRQAKVFIDRAWILSNFSVEILSLYIKIHSELNDIESIRNAYKRLGMVEASKGNIAKALKYFNLWQYTYAHHRKLDKYDYDFDILERVEQLAEPWQFKEYPRSEPLNSRKIRLAYLMYGMAQSNNVIVKINLMLAKYHDKNRFEIAFFVPEPFFLLYGLNWHQSRKNIKLLKGYNCDVIIAPSIASAEKRLLSVANQIYRYRPDILITNAMLAEMEHYFIASLRPAPLIVGLLQGPPQQFVSPIIDWGISWSKHPLIDSPCDSSLVHIGFDLPDRTSIKPYTKQALAIPDDSQILMSAGRHVKFQNRDFWKAILDILSRYPDLYYIAVGVSKEQVIFLDEISTSELSERIRLLGWREDCLSIFCLADIVIDTYPSGGGHVLIDAMALGIPFVSFENNYMQKFDQTDWSVADEFVSIPDLMINRGDFGQFKYAVSKLIDDKEYRSRMGGLCKERIHLSMSSPEKGVRTFEEHILKAIDKKEINKKHFSKTAKFNKLHKNLMSRVRDLIIKSSISGLRKKLHQAVKLIIKG